MHGYRRKHQKAESEPELPPVGGAHCKARPRGHRGNEQRNQPPFRRMAPVDGKIERCRKPGGETLAGVNQVKIQYNGPVC